MLSGRPGEVYNIGGGTEMTNRELTWRLLEVFGADWSMVEPVEDRLGHDSRYSLDFAKISSELGYAPRVPFDTGLTETIAGIERTVIGGRHCVLGSRRPDRVSWHPLCRPRQEFVQTA